jgi:PAS domain S-box-containing protein
MYLAHTDNRSAGAVAQDKFFYNQAIEANGYGPKRVNLRSDIAGEVNLTVQQLRIIDTIPTFAWSCFKDGFVEFLNRSWLAFTGLSQSEATGWGWVRAVHSEDLESLTARWRDILAGGEPGEAEARLRRFDGEYRWFRSEWSLFAMKRARLSGGTERTLTSKI